MAPRSSATDPGSALVAALAKRDFDELERVLVPGVRLRALLPPGPVEVSGAESAAARYAAWFGDFEDFELVQAGSDRVGDRVHVFYRFAVRRHGEPSKVVEQHLVCTLDDGRIAAVDLVCTGFRPSR